MQKIPRPSEGAHCRIHQPSFPLLNPHTVEEIIDEGIQKHHIKSKYVRFWIVRMLAGVEGERVSGARWG